MLSAKLSSLSATIGLMLVFCFLSVLLFVHVDTVGPNDEVSKHKKLVLTMKDQGTYFLLIVTNSKKMSRYCKKFFHSTLV